MKPPDRFWGQRPGSALVSERFWTVIALRMINREPWVEFLQNVLSMGRSGCNRKTPRPEKGQTGRGVGSIMGDRWNRRRQITPINHPANAFVAQLSRWPRIAESDLFRFRSHMGKNAPQVPLWVKTLDSLIEAGVRVTVSCTLCSKHDFVDLKLLRERTSGDYSLWNRRCRCRLSLDCKGWNRFRYVSGMAWPMWDDEEAKRWEG